MNIELSDTELELLIKSIGCLEAISSGRIEYIEHLYLNDKRYDGHDDTRREFNALRKKLLKVDNYLDAQDNVPEEYKKLPKIKNKLVQLQLDMGNK